MKKMLLTLILVGLLAISASAQITSIRDIQYAEDGGDSPLKGQVVTIQAIVTGEHRGAVAANGGISGSYFFVMDAAEAWSGIEVYHGSSKNYAAEGDLVEDFVVCSIDQAKNNNIEIIGIPCFSLW